jgi:uncharacterized protein YndB with AHSA1/START domain
MATVEREITIPATPAEVWPAVTQSGEVSVWFGADVELDARPGGRAVFRWSDGTTRHAVVEEVEPEHRLSFRWLPFQHTAERDVEAIPSTRVEITLDEVAEGTRVRVVEQAAFAVRAAAGVAPAPRWPVARMAVDRRAEVRGSSLELAAIDA